jgi:hypothetical protein
MSSTSPNKSSDTLTTVFVIICGLVYYIFFYDGCGGSSSNGGGILPAKDCTFCDGTGKDKCTSCYGEGKTNCSYCSGQGKKNCSECNGMGRKNRYVGNQYKDGYQLINIPGFHYGYVQVIGGSVNITCQKCNSSGKIDCSNISCEDGKVKCTWCNGEGKRTCSYCSGTGKD